MNILNRAACSLLGVFVAAMLSLPVCNAQEGMNSRSTSAQAELFHQLIKTRRSIRRYKQQPIPLGVIRSILDAARFAPSAGNLQSWRFIVVRQPELVREMNAAITWLRGFAPAAGETPTAHLVVLGDPVNCAFAVANLVLAAHAEGIGTCIVGSVDWLRVYRLLKIPKEAQHFVVVTMGYPLEEAVAENATGESGLKVWKDAGKTVHVPKKRLDEVMSVDKYSFK